MFKRSNDKPIFVPLLITNDWASAYGKHDLIATLPQIDSAINAIESLRSEGQHELHQISETLRHHIREDKFFQSALGGYIQCAVLVGHEISAKKFFEGSDAIWDGGSPMKLIDIKCAEHRSRHGHPIVTVKVAYRGLPIEVSKSVAELPQLFF